MRNPFDILMHVKTGVNQRRVCVVDIGSSKIAGAIVCLSDGTEPLVIAAHHMRSRGIRNGEIEDTEQASRVIGRLVVEMEKQAQLTVEELYISSSAHRLLSEFLSTTHQPERGIVTREEIERALEETWLSHQAKKPILYLQPVGIMLNGTFMTPNVNNIPASAIDVEMLAVRCEPNALLTMRCAVNQARLNIASIIPASAAAGYACMSQAGDSSSFALLELGAGVCSVSVYANGMLADLYALPLGGEKIVEDVSHNLALVKSDAERLIRRHGSIMTGADQINEHLEDVKRGNDQAIPISRAQLSSVIRPRILDILTRIGDHLDSIGFHGPHGNKVILSGGLAQLNDIEYFAKSILNRDIRLARVPALQGLPGDMRECPSFAALAGLIVALAHNEHLLWVQMTDQNRLDALPVRALKALAGSW